MTEAKRRYLREYARTHKAELSAYRKAKRHALRRDPLNSELRWTIVRWLDEQGYTRYWLEKNLGLGTNHTANLLRGETHIHPEEFKAVPELYDRLMQVVREKGGQG